MPESLLRVFDRIGTVMQQRRVQPATIEVLEVGVCTFPTISSGFEAAKEGTTDQNDPAGKEHLSHVGQVITNVLVIRVESGLCSQGLSQKAAEDSIFLFRD